MKIIGITGGIGCGKSRICSQFNAFGIESYDADSRAKQLYFSEPELLQQVLDNFPEAFENSILNLKLLGNIVFFDFQKLQILNKIIAPFMLEDFKKWLKQDLMIVIQKYTLHTSTIQT